MGLISQQEADSIRRDWKPTQKHRVRKKSHHTMLSVAASRERPGV